jgi:hypothetical protein
MMHLEMSNALVTKRDSWQLEYGARGRDQPLSTPPNAPALMPLIENQ